MGQLVSDRNETQRAFQRQKAFLDDDAKRLSCERSCVRIPVTQSVVDEEGQEVGVVWLSKGHHRRRDGCERGATTVEEKVVGEGAHVDSMLDLVSSKTTDEFLEGSSG